ncbi:hypothetical protein C8A00DRAFT_33800 [Chaetomidium leptoderma]|uniref:FAD-binding domain-containing protein n=1 Tax=Chaetomidium leptoderma TaxID=669021 RepID=A0AAN6VKW8_9PEZI|nr:hypothetical protein C8A00DRAFT_33800 [Chaetomidium leptoderma]
MSTDSKLRVLIVGASIAGPAAAYWFAKAGADVTIIERFTQLRTNGQNVDIRTVGVTVMRKMAGMETAVRAKTVPMAGINFVDTNGRPFATIRATGNPDQQSLVSEYEIGRGDLSQILFDLTKHTKNIRYVFGEQLSSIQQPENNGPVTATFTNGILPPQDFDLIVACDGATSRTRALALNCPVREHMHPLNSWAAWFTIPSSALPNNKSPHGQSYSAPGGRFLALGPDPNHPSSTRITLMTFHPPTAPPSASVMTPFRQAQSQGNTALKQYIHDHFHDAGWQTAAIVQAMLASPSSSSSDRDDGDNFYATEIAQVKTPCLFQGRVVFVGDAGYAPGPTGAGTSLALAGAYVLAGEVGVKHQGDLGGGLRGYEAVMRPVVGELQQVSGLVRGVLAPQTRWGLGVRNWVLWFVCWARVVEVVQRFVVPVFGKREEGGLPEYEWAA